MTTMLGWPVAIHRNLDRVWEDFFRGLPLRMDFAGVGGFPALNMWEEDDQLHVEAELPGMKIKDLEVTVHGNELTIKGERSYESKDGERHHRRERAVGAFVRMLTLPVPVDANKVQASLKDGVLSVTLPKTEAAKPRKIEVKC